MVVLGVVVLLVGLAIWYYPLQPVDSGPVLDGGTSFVLGDDAPLAVLGAPIAFSLTWSSHVGALNVSLYTCGTKPKCTGLKPDDYVTGETGTGGTLHWSGRADDYYALVSTAKPLTVTVIYAQPLLGGTAGVAAVVFGGFLVGLGLWLVPPALPVKAPTAKSRDEEILGPDPF